MRNVYIIEQQGQTVHRSEAFNLNGDGMKSKGDIDIERKAEKAKESQ